MYGLLDWCGTNRNTQSFQPTEADVGKEVSLPYKCSRYILEATTGRCVLRRHEYEGVFQLFRGLYQCVDFLFAGDALECLRDHLLQPRIRVGTIGDGLQAGHQVVQL